MPQQPADVVNDLYAKFGQGDIPAILAMIDENIDWHVPKNLPHGGDFSGRDGVGRFFQGIGEQWDGLELEVQDVATAGDRVIALSRIHGRLRATGEEIGYSAAHSWIVRDGKPVGFDEYVNAPITLPAAQAIN